MDLEWILDRAELCFSSSPRKSAFESTHPPSIQTKSRVDGWRVSSGEGETPHGWFFPSNENNMCFAHPSLSLPHCLIVREKKQNNIKWKLIL